MLLQVYKMPDDNELKTWQAVVLSDSQLWTHVKLAAHINDDEFVRLLRKVNCFKHFVSDETVGLTSRQRVVYQSELLVDS
jgi:hypothetical protein